MFELEQSKQDSYINFLKENHLTALTIADPNCSIDFLPHKDAIIYNYFSKENTHVAKLSFIIMNLLSPPILESFLSEDIIIEKIAIILSAQECDDLLVSKIGAILMNIFIKCYKTSNEYIPLIFNLLKYLDNDNVFELLKLITSPNLPIKSLREVLSKMNLGNYLLHEISDNNPTKIGNICFIIRNCYKNQESNEYFSDNDMVDAMTKMAKSKDIFVLNRVWQSITAICSEKTANLLGELLEIAKNISIHEIVNIHIYNVYVWDFLAKMVKMTNSEAISGDQELIQTAINLILSYQNNSNLQGALFRFLRNSLEVPSSVQMIIQLLVPFMSMMVQENSWNPAIANCKLLFTDLQFSKLSNRQLSKAISSSSFSFTDININYIEPYFLKINSTYGGDSEKLTINRQLSFDTLKTINEE